jgi:hypothetical protein
MRRLIDPAILADPYAAANFIGNVLANGSGGTALADLNRPLVVVVEDDPVAAELLARQIEPLTSDIPVIVVSVVDNPTLGTAWAPSTTSSNRSRRKSS